MTDSRDRPVRITDHESLLDALCLAMAHKGRDAAFTVDFSACTSAKIRLHYEGTQFHASLTPSAMKGIIELQASLHRSVAAILRDDADIRKLTDAQRRATEMTFSVKDGSSETETDGKGILVALERAISTMSDNHKLIALLVLGAMYFGTPAITKYLADENLLQDKIETMQHEERGQKLLAESILLSSAAARVHDQALVGYDAVIRNSGDVSSLSVQGAEVTREQIDRIKTSTRRSAKLISFKRSFEIRLVDPTSTDGFTVTVRVPQSGKIFKAIIYDSLASDATRATIKNAEWKKREVFLEITARQIGDDIVDARIISAKPIKPKNLAISRHIKLAKLAPVSS